MRQLLWGFLCLGIGWSVAPARAEVMPVEMDLRVQLVASAGGFGVDLLLSGNGYGASNGVGGSAAVDQKVIYTPSATYFIPVVLSGGTTTTLTARLSDFYNQAGNFGLSGGGKLTGPMPLHGQIALNAGATQLFTISVADFGHETIQIRPFVVLGSINLFARISGFNWESVADETGPSGSRNLTMVAPVAVRLYSTEEEALDGTGAGLLSMDGSLTAHMEFTPEPGTLLLLSSGVVGLAIAGRRRARSA